MFFPGAILNRGGVGNPYVAITVSFSWYTCHSVIGGFEEAISWTHNRHPVSVFRVGLVSKYVRSGSVTSEECSASLASDAISEHMGITLTSACIVSLSECKC